MGGKYCILGDGGLAREIQAYMRASGYSALLTSSEDEKSVIEKVTVPLIIGLGFPAPRLAMWKTYESLHHRMPAMCFGHNYGAQMQPASFLAPGSIVTTDCYIASAVFVNINVTIGHDCYIGRGTVINPGVNISGHVHIGEGCLIGTGAQILQGRMIGDGATVGAGSVVTHDVDPRTTVVGVPARRMEK